MRYCQLIILKCFGQARACSTTHNWNAWINLLKIQLYSKTWLHTSTYSWDIANSTFERTLSMPRHASSHSVKMPGSICCFFRSPTTRTQKFIIHVFFVPIVINECWTIFQHCLPPKLCNSCPFDLKFSDKVFVVELHKEYKTDDHWSMFGHVSIFY